LQMLSAPAITVHDHSRHPQSSLEMKMLNRKRQVCAGYLDVSGPYAVTIFWKGLKSHL
jgi:hypothetical protein